MNKDRTFLGAMRVANAGIALGLALWFGVIPVLLILSNLRDPGFQGPAIPHMAFRLHRTLAPRLQAWAERRVGSGRAEDLSPSDVTGNEWPLFGSVFYLWSTEALQAAWERDPKLASTAPSEDARGAIDALARLVVDPKHAKWVRDAWGDDYLHRENLFYRYLVIAALTAHYNLTRDARHLDMLRDQVETLARDIEASPAGLLDDYPGQCYPGDVAAAIACIRHADTALGTDHSAFVRHALRGFEGNRLDPVGLPPYSAHQKTGAPIDSARGCSNSYLCIQAPQLWPEVAPQWYAAYEKDFWQDHWSAVGFREFRAADERGDWYVDVDSGPTVAGHGLAASAFGLGAARANGRFDHAYALGAEMLAFAWPLPNGRMAIPKILSNITDAPYLGECSVLYIMTRTPAPGVPIRPATTTPTVVHLMLAVYALVSARVIAGAVALFRRRYAQAAFPRAQFSVWVATLTASSILLIFGVWHIGAVLLVCSLALPRTLRRERRLKPIREPHAVTTA